MNGQRGLDWLSAACFLGLLAVLSIFALVNLDLGFHLRAGELIWQEGSIPSHDVFSYIAEGRPWVDSHWLFQLVLHGVYQLGDANGLIAFRVVLVVATFGLLLAAGVASGPGSPGAEAAQPADSAQVEKSLEELLASADIERGKRLYLQCRACHSLEGGGLNKVGTNL